VANKQPIDRLRDKMRSTFVWLQAAVLVAAGIMPMLVSGHAGALQLTSRSATIDKSKVSSTNVQFVFGYTIQTSAAVQGITYEFCTTPLGTCTLPTGMSVQAAAHVGQTGFPNNLATAFTAHAVADEFP
jgi:hypothetical protein